MIGYFIYPQHIPQVFPLPTQQTSCLLTTNHYQHVSAEHPDVWPLLNALPIHSEHNTKRNTVKPLNETYLREVQILWWLIIFRIKSLCAGIQNLLARPSISSMGDHPAALPTRWISSPLLTWKWWARTSCSLLVMWAVNFGPSTWLFRTSVFSHANLQVFLF